MATYTKTLMEGTDLIAPRTLTTAVTCGDGTILESKLTTLSNTLATIEAELADLNTNWANSLTFSGSYASATYYTEAGCSLVVDRFSRRAFLTIQSGTATGYENIYFNSSYMTLPSGVTFLPTQTYGGPTSGSAQTYFTAIFTGITGPINVTVDLAYINSSYDYVRPTITMTYV